MATDAHTPSARPDPPNQPCLQPVDRLVLTAANAAQARSYRAQLAQRRRDGRLRNIRRWLVVPDPCGKRAGSGGSTFVVLYELARRLRRQRPRARSLAELFAGARILIVHSGGDSRRLPGYAAEGKVFVPLPCEIDGRQATLLDLVVDDLADVQLGARGGVMIAAGDLVLGVKGRGLMLGADEGGIVGLAFPASAEVGSRHGVYVLDRQGRAIDFLQKPRPTIARAHNAFDRRDRLLVDSGLLGLCPDAIERLLRTAGAQLSRTGVAATGLLADILTGRAPLIDLYEQVLIALAPRRTLRDYLDAVLKPGADDSLQRRTLTSLYNGLHGLPLRAHVLPGLDFLHVGTSRELVSKATAPLRATNCSWKAQRVRVIASDGRPAPASRGPAFVESCRGTPLLTLGGNNIVVGQPEAITRPLRVPSGWGMAWIPVGATDWACVLYGINDDFKTAIGAGATLGNRSVAEWLAQHGLPERDIWPVRSTSERSLWTARLWLVGLPRIVLDQSLWIWTRRQASPRHWTRRRRHSLAELIKRTNHSRLLAHQSSMERRSRLTTLADRLASDPSLPARRVLNDLESLAEARNAMSVVSRLIASQPSHTSRARLLHLAGLVAQRFPGVRRATHGLPKGDLASAAGEAIAQAVKAGARRPRNKHRSGREAVVPRGRQVVATAPVRIDLAGGWSDTPPICQELGGSVVNMAVTLDGRKPIRVTVRLTGDPLIRITSLDLGREATFTDAAPIHAHANPDDWTALTKAALALTGIVPGAARGRGALRRALSRLGGGLHITLHADIPKGSGLGTSSILGAAILACLNRLIGEPLSHARLIERASVLEQMLSTGGGWQDQAGGIAPGVKFLLTQPGLRQVPTVEPLRFPTRSLSSRLLLYYTGRQRLAKNILQTVVRLYLERDPTAVDTIRRIKANADDMRDALSAGDGPAFARCLDLTWQLKNRLDPGSSNALIQRTLARVRPWLAGATLAGAGGGGYILMVAHDPAAAGRIRDRLSAHRPNRRACFVPFGLDDEGLKVQVQDAADEFQ